MVLGGGRQVSFRDLAPTRIRVSENQEASFACQKSKRSSFKKGKAMSTESREIQSGRGEGERQEEEKEEEKEEIKEKEGQEE